MPSALPDTNSTASGKLPTWLKLIYGSGEFGLSSIGMMRSIFYAIFLTDVVGLDPRIASFGALAGIIWDARSPKRSFSYANRRRTIANATLLPRAGLFIPTRARKMASPVPTSPATRSVN